MKIRMTKYDKLWAKMVRERDGRCLNCGRKPPYVLQAHHVMPRGRRATRFVLENGITLCAHCHTLGDHSVHRVGKDFCIKLLGQAKYTELERASVKTVPESKALAIFEEYLSTLSN